MKKIFALIAALMIGCGAYAAACIPRGSYIYWTLDPVTDSMMYAYVMIAAQDEGLGTKTYLTIGNTDQTIAFNAASFPETTELDALFYSQVLGDTADTRYCLELYNVEGQMIAVSEFVSSADLMEGGYVYRDMSITGIRDAYHFTATYVPEPTGGLLFVLGLGVLALRRKKVAAV